MKKSLLALIFAVGLTLSGCWNNDWHNLLNGDRACISTNDWINSNSLCIIKKDGSQINFSYSGEIENFDLTKVSITKNGKTESYAQDEILEKAEKTFQYYYQMIIDDAIDKLNY